jgi:hypothetical protein
MSRPYAHGPRVIEGGALRTDSVDRLHKFQGEHPEVVFTAPPMSGLGRYVALVPVDTLPHDPREITVTSADLTGLMDQLDDLFGPRG